MKNEKCNLIFIHDEATSGIVVCAISSIHISRLIFFFFGSRERSVVFILVTVCYIIYIYICKYTCKYSREGKVIKPSVR